MSRPAVSPHLSQVKKALKREGVEGVDLVRIPGSINMEELIAIVASGGDIDFMGMQNVYFGLPVISAAGAPQMK